MIKASHSKAHHWLFSRYLARILKKDFQAIHWNTDLEIDSRKSILLLGNHISWWDGFWPYYINERYFRKKFHLMMLEEELAKRPFFSKLGAYSIKKHSRGILQSLQYTVELLNDAENMVVVFPQGKIESTHVGTVHFEPGLDYILKSLSDMHQIIFSVSLLDYFANRKPTLTVYLKLVGPHQSTSLAELEKEYNNFYHHCKSMQSLRSI